MAGKGLFIVILIVLITGMTVCAQIDVGKIKTEDLRLEKGQNVSLILNPGSPFSVRLYSGSVVEFDVDNVTNRAIFDVVDDPAIVRYTVDGGKTYTQTKIKLGDSERWNVTTGSWFVFINYKILHQDNDPANMNGVFELGIPLLQRFNVPMNTANKDNSTAPNETLNQSIQEVLPPKQENNDTGSNNYMSYLIGVIIVLVLIIIILGPRKKEAIKEAVDKMTSKKEVKPKKGSVNEKKAYYKKPNKKKFDEEDVYVVKGSEEE